MSGIEGNICQSVYITYTFCSMIVEHFYIKKLNKYNLLSFNRSTSVVYLYSECIQINHSEYIVSY